MPNVFPQLTLKGTSGRSKSERLKESLLSELAAGRLSPGDWLPSEQALADALGFARNTVRKSLAELERTGHITRINGRGRVVHQSTDAMTNKRQAVGTFALVVPDVATGYYPTLLAGFDRAANEAGHPIVVCNSHNDVHQQASHLMRLIDQGVAGILLNPSTETVTPAYQVRLAQNAGIPVVLLHRGVPDVKAPVLELPFREIGRRVGRMIVDAGHRRVAYLASHRYPSSEIVEQSFRESLAEAGVDLPSHCVDYGNLTRFDAEEHQVYEQHLECWLKQALSTSDRPTALFVSTPELIYVVAGRLGLKIPEDLSIIGFGGAHRQGAIMQRLTSVTVDEADVAHQAVQLVVEMRKGRRPLLSEQTIPMPLGFHQGQTLVHLPPEKVNS